MSRLFLRSITKAAIGYTAGSVIVRERYGRVCAFSDGDAIPVEAKKQKDDEEEEFQPRYPLVPEDEETEQEKQYWVDKRHCSFCSIFLDSPCRQQFKSWSMCVDKCKSEADAVKASKKRESSEEEKDDSKISGSSEGSEEEYEGCDFASHCAEATMSLFSCQGANEAYFEPFMKAEEELKKKREQEETQGNIDNDTQEVVVGDDGSLNLEINIPSENEVEVEEEPSKPENKNTTSNYIVTSIDAMPEINPDKE